MLNQKEITVKVTVMKDKKYCCTNIRNCTETKKCNFLSYGYLKGENGYCYLFCESVKNENDKFLKCSNCKQAKLKEEK